MRYTAIVVLLAVATLAAASTKFKSTWKAPGLEPVSFAGKKVVALVISDDDSLRVSSEEGLASELTDRGLNGVPSYRIIPKEEVKDPDKARGWFERAQAEGVVAMRLVDARKVQTYTPATWTGPYLREPLGLLRLRLGIRDVHSAARGRGRARDDRDADIQRSAEQAALGRRQREQEPEERAAADRRSRERRPQRNCRSRGSPSRASSIPISISASRTPP